MNLVVGHVVGRRAAAGVVTITVALAVAHVVHLVPRRAVVTRIDDPVLLLVELGGDQAIRGIVGVKPVGLDVGVSGR
jgi:hypothetical protein